MILKTVSIMVTNLLYGFFYENNDCKIVSNIHRNLTPIEHSKLTMQFKLQNNVLLKKKMNVILHPWFCVKINFKDHCIIYLIGTFFFRSHDKLLDLAKH